MKFDVQLVSSPSNAFDADLDVLVVGLPEDWQQTSWANELDQRLQGKLSKLIVSEDISIGANKLATLHLPDGIGARTLVTVGLGKTESCDSSVAFRAAASAIKRVASKQYGTVGIVGLPLQEPLADSTLIGLFTGFLGQDLYREKKSLFAPKSITVFSERPLVTNRAEAIANGIALARRLVNQPANHLYPASFVDQVIEATLGLNLQMEVWDEDRLRQERCETLLAVGRASSYESRLLIMSYPGTEEGKELPPIALVGKGVTFDSGGLSIKPSDGMMTMKCDMAGGATVVSVMATLAKLQVKRPVIGFVGLVENMISGDSFRLGDVIKSRSGKTIEIHNTDAEGRLVLADVLDVACDRQPSHLIDFATLTGACVVALGNDIGGLMTNHNGWADRVERTAKDVGELVWRLPMHSLFDEQIQSKVADLKNVGDGRWGGAITAAKFLEQFVRGLPWVHLDIAGPAFADKPKSWCDAGATGYFVHTITQLIEQLGAERLDA